METSTIELPEREARIDWAFVDRARECGEDLQEFALTAYDVKLSKILGEKDADFAEEAEKANNLRAVEDFVRRAEVSVSMAERALNKLQALGAESSVPELEERIWSLLAEALEDVKDAKDAAKRARGALLRGLEARAFAAFKMAERGEITFSKASLIATSPASMWEGLC